MLVSDTHDVDNLPMREIMALDKALQRTRGALVDNIARLSQLDNDIASAEEEHEGEEAANDPERSGAYKSSSVGCGMSGHPAWRRPLQTVTLSVHNFLAFGRQSSG